MVGFGEALATQHPFDGKEEEARKWIKYFLDLNPHATLADWDKLNPRPHPAIVRQWTRIRDTMKRLSLPEAKEKAASIRR
jgi:hypothetical protein